MAAELQTRVDKFSGIPLPIAPSLESIPVDRPDIADLHHGYHPRLDPKLLTTAGFALRNSALQVTERALHNEGPLSYHAFYKGPEIPTDEAEIFRRVVLSTAGYIPEEVIDMNNGEPYVRSMSSSELEYFQTPSPENDFDYKYLKYRYGPIRDFLRDYVIGQPIGEEHIRLNKLDEFLHTTDKGKKLNLGHYLIAKASEVATDQVRDQYYDLKRSRRMHPNASIAPSRLVTYKLGNSRQRSQLIPIMEQNIRERFAIVT